MPHSSESDLDAPETISLKVAKKSSKAQDKLVQDRNAKVATLAKEKNRARDARLKAAKEATSNRSNHRTLKSGPLLEKNGGKTQKRSIRTSVALAEDDNGIDVEPNGEEDDPTQVKMRARMEAAMHDAEDEGTEEPEGDSDADADADAEGLDGDFAFGEDDSITYEDEDGDGESEEISEDDEEMKDPEDEDDKKEHRSSIGPVRKRKGEEGSLSLSPEYGMSSSAVDYLPDELFAQAAAAITTRVQKPTDSKTKEVKRRKRSRRKVNAKDLIIGSRTVQVIKPLNPTAMAPYTVPSKSAQRFVKRRLKGGSATTGWERRPVNVGSLSGRGGPAKCFRRT